MGRFGPVTAQFFARSALNVALADSQGVLTRALVSGFSNMEQSASGRVELVFPFDPYLADLVQVGRVCTVYYGDAVLAAATPFPPYDGVPFGYPFEIEDVDLSEPGIVRVTGLDISKWLGDTQVFRPIGAATVTNSTVAVAVTEPAETTVAVSAPINNESLTLTDVSAFHVDDEVVIELDGGGTHTTVALEVDPPLAPDHIRLRDRLPAQVSAGNTIERRQRRVQVAAGQGAAFQVGVEARLTLDNNSVHTTFIEEAPDDDIITLRVAAPDGAAVGKAITATDYSQPTTSDVNTLVALVGWTAVYENGAYTGTANGTHHAPDGDTVYDLLNDTARRSGEFWRLKEAYLGAPEKKIIWRRTADYAGYGGNLRLVFPSQDDVDNEALNVNRGIITGGVQRGGKFNPVTRIVPLAGDKRITLALCSEGMRLTALALGLTVVDTGLGLYTPPYLRNATAETTGELGVISRTVTFSEIAVQTENATEWQSAADALLASAIAYMQAHGTAARYTYEVDGIVSPLAIFPGQRIELVYADPTGRWSVSRTGANALYVQSVRQRIDPPRQEGDRLVGGVPLFALTLTEGPEASPDVARTTARAIADVQKLARVVDRGGGSTKSGDKTTIVNNGGGGTGADHGTLTGLGDDDHPQYVRTDGTRPMTGSLVLGSGLLVDGVDVSAHAADPAAHHAPVTSANSAIVVAGQAVGVVLASPSALAIDNGLLLSPGAVGGGLQLINQILSTRLATNSGLLLAGTPSALGLGTPGSLTAVTTNAVTGASHSHAVSASANPGPATQLLKTDPSGYLQLFSLGIGATPDGASGLKVMSPQPTWYGLFLKQRTDQTAQMLRIENAAGAALLLVTNGGDLESGNPGFVSGLTGWQIAAGGDAEFNNVRVRGELHATTFVADEMHATGGTMQIATASNVAEPTATYRNELASMSSATTYLVVNGSWSSGLNYFPVNDVIRIKSMGPSAGGSLYIPDIYLEVAAVINLNDRNLAQGNPGRYVLQCLRKSGGYTGYKVPTGAAVVKWTYTGGAAGAYKGNMLLTADLAQSPYLDVLTVDASLAALSPWPGSGDLRTPPTIKPRVRVGNLDGVLGLTEQWGIAAGTDLSDTSAAAKYLVASNLGVLLRNIDLSMYSGANRVVYISPAGLKLLNSDTVYADDRSIRWEKSNGVVVGAVAARSDPSGNYMEIGVSPTFATAGMTENGMTVKYDPALVYGNLQHEVALASWGRIVLDAGERITLAGTFIEAAPDVRVGGGLAVGDVTIDPLTAVLLIKERAATAASPTSTAQLWIQRVGGVQKLYVKFDNGVQRELASA